MIKLSDFDTDAPKGTNEKEIRKKTKDIAKEIEDLKSQAKVSSMCETSLTKTSLNNPLGNVNTDEVPVANVNCDQPISQDDKKCVAKQISIELQEGFC